jgi:hypothetical protein
MMINKNINEIGFLVPGVDPTYLLCLVPTLPALIDNSYAALSQHGIKFYIQLQMDIIHHLSSVAFS